MDIKNRNLPYEIIINILKYIDNIEDLITIYKISENVKKLIIKEIFLFLKMEENNRTYHFLNKLLIKFIDYLNFYKIMTDDVDKNKMGKIIKQKYNEHEIFRILIKYKLKCDNCKYIYNIENIKNIYKCICCNKEICNDCDFKSFKCYPKRFPYLYGNH